MIMADVFTVALIVLGLWVALPALFLLLRSALPDLVARAGERAAARPGRSFLIGLAVSIPGLVLVAALGARPPGKPLAALLLASLVGVAFVGVAALATRLGSALPSPRDEAQPWLTTARGAVCLVVAGTLPILGWFLLWPITLLMGAGATVSAVLSRGSQASEASASSAAFPPAATVPAEPVETSS